MAKQRPDAHQNTWQDVSEAVALWEATLGLRVRTSITWEPRLSSGAAVEVILEEGGTIGRGEELVRIREAFPAKRATGQAGAVLWAISCAIRCLEKEPWLWSRKMRRDALNKP